jgi:hypothetical protein
LDSGEWNYTIHPSLLLPPPSSDLKSVLSGTSNIIATVSGKRVLIKFKDKKYIYHSVKQVRMRMHKTC